MISGLTSKTSKHPLETETVLFFLHEHQMPMSNDLFCINSQMTIEKSGQHPYPIRSERYDLTHKIKTCLQQWTTKLFQG